MIINSTAIVVRFCFLTKNILNSELLLLLLFFNIEKFKKEKTFLNILNLDFFVLSIIFTIDKLKKRKNL